MHAFFATRGIKKHVDEVVKFLETRTMLVPFKDETGKERFQPLQGNLQPIQLWSYVFPEYEQDAVLTTLKFDKENRERWIGDYKMKAVVESLRLMLNARKIPEFKADKRLPMPMDAMEHVSIIPIGVKYDIKDMKFPNGTVYEAL